MRFIILLDISPLLLECCPYVGNVQVIESEGCIPSIVRVGVIALICNTRGDERLLCFIVDFQLSSFEFIIIKYEMFQSCCFI